MLHNTQILDKYPAVKNVTISHLISTDTFRDDNVLLRAVFPELRRP